jgi:hypothetical protein
MYSNRMINDRVLLMFALALVLAYTFVALTSCNWREPTIDTFHEYAYETRLPGQSGEPSTASVIKRERYRCREMRPLFWADATRRICNTLDECNTYCENLRKEYMK